MRRVLACASLALSACLFPSLDGLTDGGAFDATGEAGFDATPDVTANDAANDTGADAIAEAGMCPPNNDPSLVAYYPFDEGAGTVAHDCSGHGYDAVVSGTNAQSAWTTGHVKGGIAFNSSDQICVIVGASANQSGGPLTVSAWYDMPSSSSGGYLVGQRHQTGYAWRIDIEWDDAGAGLNLAIGTNDGSGNDVYAAAYTGTDAYHHVAGVYDPTGPTQKLYLDGVEVDSTSSSTTIALDPIASTIRVGCRDDDTNFFDGVIDEVRVYSRALAASEISALAKQ